MKNNIRISLLLTFLTFNLLTAQNVRIFPNANNITTDDRLVISVELSNASGRVARPNFPEIKGFLRTGTSTQQNMSPTGYLVSFSQTYVPQNAGTFTIPKVTYELAGKTFKYGPSTVKVTKGTGKRNNKNGQGDSFSGFFKDPFDEFFKDPFGPASDPKDLQYSETNADYFLSFNLNKKLCYVGEQLIGEVVLYINQRDAGKINVDGMAILEMQNRIKNSGFWQETYDFTEVPMKPVMLNGKRYFAYTLYRTYLFPIQPGQIDFDDLYLDAKKLLVATNASIRQRIMGQNTKFEPVRIRAPKSSLMVKRLPPTNLPQANMVGSFSMDGTISTQEINTGEVLELKLKVKGNGNMAMLPDPQTNFPKEFDVDAPSTNLKTSATKKRYMGEKDYTYYLLPKRNGNYDLGPIKLYYFNPTKEVYDSLSVESIPVKVNGEDLENLVLKQSGNDEFYQAKVAEAGNTLKKDRAGNWMIFVGGFLMVAGVMAFKFAGKTKKKTDTPLEVPKDKLD